MGCVLYCAAMVVPLSEYVLEEDALEALAAAADTRGSTSLSYLRLRLALSK